MKPHNYVALKFEVAKNEQLSLGCKISLNEFNQIKVKEGNEKQIGIVTDLYDDGISISCDADVIKVRKRPEPELNKMSKLEFMNKD